MKVTRVENNHFGWRQVVYYGDGPVRDEFDIGFLVAMDNESDLVVVWKDSEKGDKDERYDLVRVV